MNYFWEKKGDCNLVTAEMDLKNEDDTGHDYWKVFMDMDDAIRHWY